MGWQPHRFGAVHIINSSANPRDAAIYRFHSLTEVLVRIPRPKLGGTIFDRIEMVVL